jgi:hypothetical protein
MKTNHSSTPAIPAKRYAHRDITWSSPTNDHFDALVKCLALTIVAPSDKKAKKCLKMVDEFSYGMTHSQVERAKAQALILVEQFEAGGD